MEDEHFYKSILESMRDMVLVKGPESKLLWANKAFRNYYGMTAEELRGLIDGAQSNPDDTLQYVRDDKFVFDERKDLNIPSEPVTNSAGEVNYFHTVKSPVFNKGEMSQSVGVSRLIDDQEIEEQDLTELDAKVFTAPLRSIIDSYPIATMLLDHDLRVIKCNRRWSKFFGDAPSISNTNFNEHYENLADLVESSKQSVASNTEIENVIKIKMNSESKYFDFKTSPWKYPNDTIGGIMIVATDVTALKQNAEELRITQEKHAILNRRFVLAMEASAVGIWEWNLSTQELIWDKQMYSLYGIKERDFEGAFPAWEKGLHPGDKERSLAEIEDAAKEIRKFDTEFRVIWPSGEVRHIRALASVIKDDSGKPEQMIGVNWDITNVKKAQRNLSQANTELSQVNEELTQFSYRTSHDLKAPLTTSKKLAEFTLQDIESGDYSEAKSNISKIHKQMGRLESLVSDILSLAKADFAETDNQPIDFQKVIQSIQDKLSWMDEGGQFSIKSDVIAQGSFIGDRIRISQVLENLISNAIKYKDMKKSDQFVDVKVAKSDTGVQIVVTDNGIGIPENFQSDLFKMFKRFHPGIASGSGLGLSIVKKNIDRMNGTIDINSSSEGTCLTIGIPNGTEQ